MQPTALIPKGFASAASRCALLWLVVALLFQGFATQTHGHVAGDRAWAATSSASVLTAAADGKRDPAAQVCPLCEEKALFGAYLLGGSAAIAVPVVVTYDYVAVSWPLLALRAFSHAWQSRAPPVLTI